MWAPFIFAAVIATIFVVLATLAVKAEKKRQAVVAAAASELGLACSPLLAADDRSLFDTFSLANIGRDRNATSATTADSGELRLVLFDYQYTVASGKNRQTPTYSVVMATSGGLNLPQFSLSPESFFHRLADFFGYKDIDFDDDPTFSNQFLLKGENEPAIRNFFTAERRAALLPLGQVYVEGRGTSFLCYRTGKQRDAAHLRSMLEEGFDIYSHLGDQRTSSYSA